MQNKIHQPVLLKEVLEQLDPKPDENFVDCTFGFGGHGLAFLEKNKPQGKVLGIEIEKRILEQVKKEISNPRLILVNDSYRNLKKIIKENDFAPVNGILLDLGLCSWHFEMSGRGFSFLRDESLDMRFGDESQTTAQEIINSWPKEELERIFREYGEERRAAVVAKAICEGRRKKRIETVNDLLEALNPIFGERRGRISPATKIFQALRIAVNDELGNLINVLPQAIEALEQGGRLAVISFHSLEDRIVKNAFRNAKKEGIVKILTKKPVRPGLEEIRRNRRSRSAKLRVVLKK